MKREAQHDEDLQANWKSALCVTSLYDSYIQLQQENDALKAEVRELKHANEILTVQQIQRKSPRKRKSRPGADENLDSNVVVGGIADGDSDDDDNESAQRYEQSRKEIRLLRAEKEHLELVHTQYRKDTESQIAEYKTMYDQLTEKYQQRYALDPNGAKRVELAVQTLQDTLEEVMQEKDELAIRYKKLQEVYNQLQQEHNRTMHTLRAELQELQSKRTQKAKQSVATVLQRWYTVQLADAWKQWTMNVAVSRMKETEKQSTDLLQRHYKAQAKHQRNHLVAKAMMRFMQASARRTFLGWKQVVESKQNIRIQSAQFRRTNKYRTLEQVFARWKQATRSQIARRLSVERLRRVMVAHKAKNCWRKWTKEVFTNQVISEFKQKLFLLNKVMLNMKTELENANAKLTAAELDNGRLVAKHDIERIEMKSIMEQKHSTANELVKRIGTFFSRKNDRQLMQQIVAQWKSLSDIKRKRGHHTQLARAKLQRLKIQRSVSTWYAKTQNRQRYMHIVGHFVKRIQQLGAVRCFNAWRDNVDRKKQREQTLRSVISHMIQKHLVTGFRAWVAFRAQRQKVRHSIDLMCSICYRSQLYSAFTIMKHQIAVIATTNEAKKKLELETQWEKRFEQAKQDTMRLRKCLLYWRQRAMKMKSCDKLALKTVKRWRNGILARLFTEWQRYVHEQRRQREFISRWLRRYSVTSLQSAWAKWQKHMLLKCKQEEITRLQAENDDRVAQLQKEIDGLRVVHRNLVVENQQMKLNMQQQLQDAHKETEIEIRRYKKYTDAFMLVYSQKQRTKRLLEYFKLWEKWVSTRKCKRRLVFNFAKACQQRVMLGVFKKWNYLYKHRCRLNAGVGLFRAVLDQHCIRQYFYTWVGLFQSSRKVRDFQEKHEHIVTQRLCRAVLQEWRIEARKSYLVRRTAERIWLYSVHIRMKQLFYRWAKICKHEAFIEQKTRRKRVLTSIQAKICLRWTSRSLRVTFGAWQSLVCEKRRQKRAENKIIVLYMRHVMNITLKRLQTFAGLQHQRRMWLKKCLARIVHARQNHAFGQWKLVFLRQQRQEIDSLRQIHADLLSDLGRRREEATTISESSIKVEKRLERAILEIHFYAWKAKLRETRSIEKVMKRLTMSAEKQELLIAFSTWKEVWRKRKFTMVTVEMRRKTIQQATLRRYFFEWCHMMATQKTLERKTRKLIAQRTTRLLRQRFEDWRANLSLNAALSTLLPRLNEIAVRVKVESGFTKWAHVVTLKKTLEDKERERQRRIMEFIMGRHEWNLERIFGAWQSYASSRRAKHAEAQKRLTARLTKLKSSTWRTWRDYILCANIQKHLLSTLEKNLTAYHVRIAVSKWKRHIHHTLVLKLQEHNAILSQENKRVSDESNLNAALVKDLQASLVESDQHISHLETKLSCTSSTTSRFHVKHQRERDRTRALGRLVSRNLVIKDVLQAFSRWKNQTIVISSQYASLETLERLLRRKQRELAFQDWRRKTISAMKLQHVQQRRRKSQQMALMNMWKNYCRRNLRVKLVLMRLCGNVNMNAQEHGLSVLGAFRIWQKHSDAVRMSSQAQMLFDQLQRDKMACLRYRKLLLLAKWCWQAYTVRLQSMHSFFSKCQRKRSAGNQLESARTIQDLQGVNEQLTQRVATLALEIQEAENKKLEGIDERSVISSSYQGIQMLFRRLAQVSSIEDLFLKVSSAFSQLLRGSSAILFLHDPCNNELWTLREDKKVIQVPASLGIAGYTLTTCSTLIVDDINSDQRFHPMVDQLVLSVLPQEIDGPSSLSFSTSSKRRLPGKPAVCLFSSALLSPEGTPNFGVLKWLTPRLTYFHVVGSAYGVLQVAWSASHLSTMDSNFDALQGQLFGRLCCFYVEQMLHEIVRNSPDRTRVRVPESFIKLFKQTKNWRKYYVLLERKARQLEEKLQTVCADRDSIADEQAIMQQKLDQTRLQLEVHKHNEAEISSQIILWKKKMTKLKALLQLKEKEIAEKTQEVQDIAHEFARYRREQRSRGLQAALLSNSALNAQKRENSTLGYSQREDVNQSASILRADNAALKNQLVRAESDSLLLVKAIDVACKHHGELPNTMRMEVNRIALRIQHTA